LAGWLVDCGVKTVDIQHSISARTAAPCTFAAEVRSEGDYGPRAEEDLAQKRADCLAAGRLVVWDVDLPGEEVVKVYRRGSAQPTW
jgi:hypothetical protein